jgi:hypothetical protein
MNPLRLLRVVSLTLLAAVLTVSAQQPPAPTAAPGEPAAPGARGGPGAGGGRGGFSLAPRPADDATGFVSLFDGKSLAGWEGDLTFWRAEDGMIVGESTPEKVVSLNSFLIWRGGTVKNFELKLEFRMNGTNSGIQYRSVELPDVGKWILKGYQADLDFINQHTGNIHDERGRAFLSRRGKFSRALGGSSFKEIATVGDPDELKGAVKINDWNSYHIIARDAVLIHVLNGKVMAILIDEDPARTLEGLLGFQMHVGPPFKVEYRNILLRTL